MSETSSSLQAFVFARRGTLLAIPAVALAALGKPSAFSIAAGLPLVFAGEAVRAWAVGYSGVTTRGSAVEAPALVTAGPYAYVRNPLYVGNFLTATGFALAFTGANTPPVRAAIVGASLAAMLGVYAVIVPHEEAFLRATFGAAFDEYAARVPRVFPALEPAAEQSGSYDPSVIGKAESRTFVTLGAMLAALALKALQA
jgi:protein-S-isoprenylcysteine O-methyltransferase Ste14